MIRESKTDCNLHALAVNKTKAAEQNLRPARERLQANAAGGIASARGNEEAE
jgi:hypothetical protein